MFLPITLPPHLIRPYRFLRLALWGVALLVGGMLFLAMIFPDFQYSFSFRNPNASGNNLLDPRLIDGTPRPNGKIAPMETLVLNAGVFGDFSDARITAKLESTSELTKSIEATLRKSYRAFLLPIGPPLTEYPKEDLYRVDDTYYALRDGTLHPFVSEKAFLSRYQPSAAQTETANWLQQFPLSENFIGFRVGSLLSFADGVFIVTSESDIRPVGSAEIFLALGYRFQDVLPVSEEDLGIYKRGRIIELGFTHPTGTLFLDQDTDTVYAIDGLSKRMVESLAYREFLEKKQLPIAASQNASKVFVHCTLTPGLLARALSCRVPIDLLSPLPGSDLELALSMPTRPIDINTLSIKLETRKNVTNALRLFSQMKERILNRFGLGL